MYKKRRGLMCICALAFAVLAVGTFSACGGGNADAAKEASTASSSIAGMAEKVAPSITARIEFLLDDAQQHPDSVSEQQQDILRRALDHDGVIPRGDYDAAWSRYQDCMVAKGYTKPVTEEFTGGLRSNVMHPYMEGSTKAQQSKFFEDDTSCRQLEYLYVDEIYRANLGNPNQYTDMDTAVVDCLRRKNLVGKQYTLTQFKQEDEQYNDVAVKNFATDRYDDSGEAASKFSFDLKDPATVTCFIANGKDYYFREDTSPIWNPLNTPTP
ncbi:hypothetical protein [Bifidobacterium pseudolongum]|uniref:hypothetical protein n=1 Tax=Bifidobacterium pseudolongum TaxID=1694 RepID=UPI00101F8497|nr:hypothetical protein [Bifidobacterium pseudolongum]RYQ02253.1 hypothetical protein PG2115B_0227 [Bifidobacterium pseudolongum subsp. globosum]RYQ06440.1 hypothetical protein PG2114B_0213 [Bifidobacterium pseudolongum subsp. globosum]RYQ13235.1 hypothetical protein PG2089B_0208 [Bifidobacterium pseudolongum subsp. globosum]